MRNGFQQTLLAGVTVAGLVGLGYGIGTEFRRNPGQVQAAPPVTVQNLMNPDGSEPVSGESQFVRVADRLMPSVVNVFTSQYAPRGDLWRFFGGAPGYGGPNGYGDDFQQAMPGSLGTGFVVETFDGGGLIVTNHHVVARADDIRVKFTEDSSEREVPAELVGVDPDLDVALLKVRTQRKLAPVTLGDSEALKVGEWIAAIGNPFGHGHSVSHGIVSAKARTLPGALGKYLQVDAPINPGNSGGPLVSMRGEVIGINNAIDARGPGIGFAIPINAVKASLAQLKKNGKVERGYIGVAIAPSAPVAQADGSAPPSGTLVTSVQPGQPAARAGVRPADQIVEVDGKPVSGPDSLLEIITSTPVGKDVQVKVLRRGQPITMSVTVGTRPGVRS